MALCFFDASALVRRYDPTEPGAATVRDMCRPASGNTLLLSRMTSAEVASALDWKVRERAITAAQRDRFWRQFRAHARLQYRVSTPDDETFRRAERLLFRHVLRTSDAIQLAAALQAERLLASVTDDFRFCTADERQRRAAEAERLTVEFIA
jgi:predicted nucleic acid-binding protein